MITVFTNGCFDLLNVAHCRLLEWARSQGTRLVVGLNSDESVRRLKGPHRPIIPELDRAEMLLALRWVDQVIIFQEDTPLELIITLRPRVLVKGPDYRGRRVVGQEFVESIGGCVMTPDWPI
jgi:D-beta-D-heptose 7-phosphate kinase/D-beta-D-heptose 1-phosphate adenosyltransferase